MSERSELRRVAVIGGGANCEHSVSLASAAAVAGALDPAAYDILRLTIDPRGAWHDEDGLALTFGDAVALLQTCEVVLPIVHGPRGEDGTLAALCDLAGVPYVGSGVRAGALAMDKWTTKLIAGAIGVASAPGVLVTPANAAAYQWTHPVVVKPVAAGSSHGVSLVAAESELAPALALALALDDRVLVEDLIIGREIDLAVLGRADGSRVVSPALEIVVEGVFGFEEKYGGNADFRIPAPLQDADRKALEAAAVATYDALGCQGVARVDFFLTADGPVLNEINTMPGFTEFSQVPRMFAAAGLSYRALLDILVQDVLAAPSTPVLAPAPLA
ncbi:MAG: D-alanine--D-alanine ligase family protein [Sporichthyaceae bacterium]